MNPGSFASFSSVPGWTAIPGGRIEIWRAFEGVTASDGVNSLELDYELSLDGFSQSVTTAAGQTYTLTFDARLRTAHGATAATQGVEVVWNGVVIQTITPASGTAWTQYSINVTGTGGSDTLTIREVAAQGGNGLGALLDNFALVAAGGSSNAAPVVAVPIADQTADDDVPFSFTVPSGTFTDANGDTLTYSATLANGDPLPGWLNFNAATRTFSGTPLQANAGALTVRVTANDGNGGQANDVFVLTVTSDSTASLSLQTATEAKVVDLEANTLANVARVLLFGDSLTEGWTVPGGFRQPLFELLVEDTGVWVNLVGDRTQNPAGFQQDIDHSGEQGLRAETAAQLAAGIASRNPHDFALVLLGTNEILNIFNPENTVPGYLLTIMRALEAANPNVTVLIGTIPFIDRADLQAAIAAVNAALPAAIAQAQSEGINASLVNLSSINASDLSDGLHPNAAVALPISPSSG